jgi:hypothetical protein
MRHLLVAILLILGAGASGAQDLGKRPLPAKGMQEA